MRSISATRFLARLGVTASLAMLAGAVPGSALAQCSNTVGASLQVSDVADGLTATQLATALVGEGVSISNAVFTGNSGSAGTFTDTANVSGIDSGLILSSGCAKSAAGPNLSDGQSENFNAPGDASLNAIVAPTSTFDASVLDFDFVPTTNQIVLRYVFGSDEYNEYANGGYNDVFALFVNGTNVALLPDSTTVVSINTVNGGRPLGTGAVNPQYYRNNDPNEPGATLDIEPDGLTVVLTATANVTAYATNHFKVALADAGDTSVNSWIFIENASLSATGCGNGSIGAGESCDDANLANGDGCNSSCQVEDCWACSGAPSTCAAQAPTITTVDSTGLVGRYANMALGSDGLPIIAYYDDTNDRMKIAHCNDAACTTSTKSILDPAVGDVINWQHGMRMIIGSDGLPFLAYHHQAQGKLGIAHCSNVACTSSTITTIDARPSFSGLEPGLTLGSDGNPFITHGEQGSNERRAVRCLNPACTSRNADVMSSSNYRYGHTTLGTDGWPLNVQGQGDKVRVSKCNNRNCTSSVTTTDVVFGGGATPWVAATDIEVAPSGLGFFTYHDGETGELYVARCSNPSCSSISTSLLDGAVGLTEGLAASSSIVFEADGRARIAYYDTDDGNLRFAECLDAACTLSSRRDLDSTGDVGRDASMVRSGGRPLVSYFDTTNADLKVAYCAGASGNGTVDAGEGCDDGNLVAGDGCDPTGEIETCYDCSGTPSVCTSHCGDGVVDPDEQCDDGDLSSGDGCSSEGELELCYTCVGEPSVCTYGCPNAETVDGSFDGDGTVTTAVGNQSRYLGVTVQSDGRIVAVGSTKPGSNTDFLVARYLDDGTLDTTFSGDGIFVQDMAGEDDAAVSVAIQPNGKIVVAGRAFNGSESYNVALLRLNADGTLDTTFSGDGIQMSNFGGDDRADGVAVQSDGKIVVGGMRGDGVQGDMLAARYLSNGTLDTTFSGDGVVWTDLRGQNLHDEGHGVALQIDGRIVVAGLSSDGDFNDFALVRYNSDGTLDTSFDGDGKRTLPVSATTGDEVNGVAIQSDGRIVVAGFAGNGSNDDFAVARFLASGALDTSFGGDGVVTTAMGPGQDVARGVDVRSDGAIVVAGSAFTGSNLDFAIARYLADGSLDSSFATDGRATTAIGASDDHGWAVAVDNELRAVVAGHYLTAGTFHAALVRYANAICGNGDVEPGELCDDGNLAGGDCCSATCLYESFGSGCADDGLVCSTDICNGTGSCVHSPGNAGTTCRGSAGICDVTETCTGASTSCPADGKSTAPCRASVGECDVAESCDGLTDACPADAKEPGGTTCTSDGNVCTNDVCDGSGNTCTHPNNSASCDDGLFCTGADTCSGGTCSSHAGDPCSGGTECADACNEAGDHCFDAATTPCSSDGNVCTDDVCDGAGGCGVSNTAPCDDDVFCNGEDTCGGGVCNHAGDPCPGTDCNTCQEDTNECVDPVDTPCLDEATRYSECTNDRCDGSGVCLHTPITLAHLCNWAVVGGNGVQSSKVRTRLAVQLGGGVCADKADIGVNAVLDDSSWAALHETGSAMRFRGNATFGSGSVVTGGGCIKSGADTDILGTGMSQICCDDGIIPLAGGGVIDACGTDPAIVDCTTAIGQVSSNIMALAGLASTRNVGALSCSPTSPCTIDAPEDLNVIDASKLTIQTDGVLTIDAMGNADAVVILRVERGVKSKPYGRIVLTGGLDASNFAIYAIEGGCTFGDFNEGAGALFCPDGKVQLKLNTVWRGSIGAGSSITLRDNVVLEHVPFLGLAD